MMTQERLIELIDELWGGWEMNVNERAVASEYPEIEKIRDEVRELLRALKERRIAIQAVTP